MQEFIPGQRWISNADTQLGLGTVLSVDQRTVTIVFLATGDTRIYARETAPLTRVAFSPGDTVLSHDNRSLEVASVDEENGLLSYTGNDENGVQATVQEGELNNFIQLNRPAERLFSGQIDTDRWFELRYDTMQHLNRLASSDLYGLVGCRTSLIPHQLYIAHEVASRYAPRILLADEVGLGKTIEAGLILHHQLLTERAGRVLILVPESLVHQWLVEMLRRFNLYFSIFDEERCQAIEDSTDGESPFQSEQLVLCNLEFLVQHPERVTQALDGDWDLLVVDEAHHLQWSPQHASPEYALVEQLAERTRGVLLLTATPEQLGKDGHFARLRLLDPDRFPDFEHFLEEEKGYQPVAGVVEALLNDQPLNAQQRQVLDDTIREGDNRRLIEALETDTGSERDAIQARRELVEHLLDRHGTGRVLFRNTRAAIKGFPQRQVNGYPLASPPAYAHMLAHVDNNDLPDAQQLLSLESLYRSTESPSSPHWTQIDPRVAWLTDLLEELRPARVLVIVHVAQTAVELTEALRVQAGIHAAVFHEGMRIVERDRAAAFFADTEAGTQVLVCSEIGSEGRNFQFAHEMVLFDLPLNPDLLEQRIGRLDRIGQTETIRIHVPWLEGTAQNVMFNWYHEGLSAFEHTCPAGHAVYLQVKSDLQNTLLHPDHDHGELINATRRHHRKLNDSLQHGRDRLLEYNSCRPQTATELQHSALQESGALELANYMERIFDHFGIDSEPHSRNCYIIRPGSHMVNGFPGLPEDGMTITWDRDTALANEDVRYVTWEHPLTISAMDAVRSGETGNTALSAVRCPGIPPGSLLLECLFVLEAAAIAQLQTNRYLPPSTFRIVMDETGYNHKERLDHRFIGKQRTRVDADTARKVVQAKQQELRELLSRCEQEARSQVPELLATAHRHSKQILEREINRLKALRQINPNVRDDEINWFEEQLAALTQVLESASLRLDALRVIVTT